MTRFSVRQFLFWAVLALLVFPQVIFASNNRTLGLIFRDSSATAPGYTLFAPMSYTVTYLIDNDGMMVHSWEGFYRPGLAVSLCENGLLLRTCYMNNSVFSMGGGSGGRVELVDWEGNVVWSYNYSSATVCQHHDAIMLPGGNVLMIAWEYKSRSEAIAAGRNPNLLVYDALWPDHLIEVNPNNNEVVWEWHVWDHIIQDYDSTKPNYGDPREHPELIDLNYVAGIAVPDWNHCNSVAFNPELDQVIISSRQFSEVWVIDHSTTTAEARGHSGGRYGRGGDLLYRWGNPRTYRRQETVGQTLYGQHDAQWIGDGLPGAGHIILFNNGYGRTPTFSTVDEFIAPQDSAGFYYLGTDSAYGPPAPVWQYIASPPESMYSSLISGCQRLANGNTLICAGLTGVFLEVTADGRLVWKYVNPVTRYGPQQQGGVIPAGLNDVFKVRRYPPDYPGLAGRNLDPLGPIETYPQALDEFSNERSSRAGCLSPMVVRGNIRWHGVNSAELADLTGRVRLRLYQGDNDIRKIPAGVYYLRPESGSIWQRVLVVK